MFIVSPTFLKDSDENIPYYLRNIVQNGPKTPKNEQSRGRPNTLLGLVTTKVLLRHSFKISRECSTFLKALINIPK